MTKGLQPGAAVLITGAASGIGKATAIRLLADGYRVFGGVLLADEACDLQGELGPCFTQVRMDVRDEHSLALAVAQVAKALGSQRLNALLNCAGIISNGPLADLDAGTFSNVLAVNVVGIHATTRAFLPLLGSNPQRAGAPARIINISSASGRRTMPFTGAYSASKFGVEALSTAMRMEFKPLGIDVVVIAPGLVRTPMAAHIQQDLQKPPSMPLYREPLRRFLKLSQEATRRGIPMERVVRTIAQALCDPRPKSRYELHNSFFRDVILMRALPVWLRDVIVARTLALQVPR
ncbi:MAG: SDR family NAD(P)-dependent oxidoreductase [Pseudomonadota bacterium]